MYFFYYTFVSEHINIKQSIFFRLCLKASHSVSLTCSSTKPDMKFFWEFQKCLTEPISTLTIFLIILFPYLEDLLFFVLICLKMYNFVLYKFWNLSFFSHFQIHRQYLLDSDWSSRNVAMNNPLTQGCCNDLPL